MELGPPPPRPAPAGDGESSGLGAPLSAEKNEQRVPNLAVALPKHAADACPGEWDSQGRSQGENEESSQHCHQALGRDRVPDGLPEAFPDKMRRATGIVTKLWAGTGFLMGSQRHSLRKRGVEAPFNIVLWHPVLMRTTQLFWPWDC
ncbi:hypothetical protein TURU_069019 [Turdus rufiventris]|nr:hypothetical protein TURU_069019 [Turdus rufiventris]